MFMNKDTELHELIRSELILPYVFGDFHPADLSELSGGLSFAFFKANGVDIRPLLNPAVWRRIAAALEADFLKKPAHKYFTTTIPNFKQFAGAMPDGASRCATLLQVMYSIEAAEDAEWPRAVVQTDVKNAFNEANRQTAFDTVNGKVSRPYDNGNV